MYSYLIALGSFTAVFGVGYECPYVGAEVRVTTTPVSTLPPYQQVRVGISVSEDEVAVRRAGSAGTVVGLYAGSPVVDVVFADDPRKVPQPVPRDQIFVVPDWDTARKVLSALDVNADSPLWHQLARLAFDGLPSTAPAATGASDIDDVDQQSISSFISARAMFGLRLQLMLPSGASRLLAEPTAFNAIK